MKEKIKYPRVIDVPILRALSNKSGNVSYLMEVIAHACSNSSRSSHTLNYKELSRKAITNRVDYMVGQGYLSKTERTVVSRSRDNAVYHLTDKGRLALTDCEKLLENTYYLTSA